MFAVNAIMFNHESPRRGETFVTRKITRAVARIQAGQQQKLYLGNLDSHRDFGYAPEYVEGMWMMMQQDMPEDFVFATGESITIREFVSLAFDEVGLSWKDYVEIDEKYFRPTEVDNLRGDASKAQSILGWEPSVNARELVALMVQEDIELLRHEGGTWIDRPRFQTES